MPIGTVGTVIEASIAIVDRWKVTNCSGLDNMSWNMGGPRITCILSWWCCYCCIENHIDRSRLRVGKLHPCVESKRRRGAIVVECQDPAGMCPLSRCPSCLHRL